MITLCGLLIRKTSEWLCNRNYFKLYYFLNVYALEIKFLEFYYYYYYLTHQQKDCSCEYLS